MAEVRISGTREPDDVEMAGDAEEDVVEVVETEDGAGAGGEAPEEIQEEAPRPQLSFIECVSAPSVARGAMQLTTLPKAISNRPSSSSSSVSVRNRLSSRRIKPC